mmetsp:Transcript_130056/g.277789  ORF Transcript_130056/g.277789 Transcript_130056/m.277789 type:complete len:193 (+) Transcript_130056:333-911(+)
MKRQKKQEEVLQERRNRMKQLEEEYAVQLERLKDKMDKREPLFKLDEVRAAFDMQKKRQEERKKQLAEEERMRWEHLRSVESNACKRPLLIEDAQYRPPRPTATQSTPDASAALKSAAHSVMRGGMACDARISDAMSQRWFTQSKWAEEVREIKERAANRQKLHECDYPPKGDAHVFARDRLRHASCATLYH